LQPPPALFRWLRARLRRGTPQPLAVLADDWPPAPVGFGSPPLG
jgi:hypothetical protein